MLDPLSALGLVSNIVQLVSFTAEIVAETRAYSKGSGGTLRSYETVSQLVEQQHAAYSNICSIEGAQGPLRREEDILKSLAQKCTAQSHELICILDRFAPKGSQSQKRKFGTTFAKVFKAKFKRKDVEQSRKILQDYRNELNFALITLIRCNISDPYYQ